MMTVLVGSDTVTLLWPAPNLLLKRKTPAGQVIHAPRPTAAYGRKQSLRNDSVTHDLPSRTPS
jgi:hypothetical protein